MRRGLLLLLLPVWASSIQGADETDTGDQLPSLELLEYLAEYSEDEHGRLLDPMDQSDENEPHGYSYREYMQERMNNR